MAADARVALSDLRFHRPAQTGVGREDVLRDVAAAIRVFNEVGDEAGLARALTLGGKLRFWGGEAAAALAGSRAGRTACARCGDRAQEAESLRWAFTVMRRGPVPVEEALGRCRGDSLTHGDQPGAAGGSLGTRAHLEAMQGHFDAARDSIVRRRRWRRSMASTSCSTPTHIPRQATSSYSPATRRRLSVSCDRPVRAPSESGELGFLSSIAPYLVDAIFLQGRDEEALLLTERWRPERLTVPEMRRTGRAGDARGEGPGTEGGVLDEGRALRSGSGGDHIGNRLSRCASARACRSRRGSAPCGPPAGVGGRTR